jgi:hypothetical protein
VDDPWQYYRDLDSEKLLTSELIEELTMVQITAMFDAMQGRPYNKEEIQSFRRKITNEIDKRLPQR